MLVMAQDSMLVTILYDPREHAGYGPGEHAGDDPREHAGDGQHCLRATLPVRTELKTSWAGSN